MQPHTYVINGTEIQAFDHPGSRAADWIADEIIRDCYHLTQIAFVAGDIVVDVGAHIGLLSIYLAKRNPSITIFAFEPFPPNFDYCQRNIALNQIANVHLSDIAITSDGRDLTFAVDPTNSGSATAVSRRLRSNGAVDSIRSTTLDEAFNFHQIERCKLLKIDCEGLEYEILYHTRILDRVEHLSGEFHVNDFLRDQGHTPQNLYRYCLKHFPAARIHIEYNQIDE